MNQPKRAPPATHFQAAHTSNAVCTYGSAAVCLKGRAIKIVLSVIIISVAFSRLYLGVHTPSDVLVSLVAGAPPIVFLSSRLYGRLIKADHRTFLLTAVSAVAVSAAAAVFIRFKPYGGGYEFELVKDGYLACGLLAGLFAGWYFERKYLDFSPSGGIIFQIVKTIAGLASSLLIMWLGGLAVDMLPCIREAVYVVKIRPHFILGRIRLPIDIYEIQGKEMFQTMKIGFFGAGNMATAIIKRRCFSKRRDRRKHLHI